LLKKKWREQAEKHCLKSFIERGASKEEIEHQKQLETEFEKKSKEMMDYG